MAALSVWPSPAYAALPRLDAHFRWAWASWVILYEGGETERQLALKRFDRLRFPVKPERDMWSLVCTWGHSKDWRDGMNYATEPEILKEMPLTAEMSIDLLLIDAGWQTSLSATRMTPDGGLGWKPHPEAYPEGWTNVIRLKNQLGLKLGLWGIAQQTPAEDMIWNWEQLQMNQMKLDFASFKTHDDLNRLLDTTRTFMDAVGQRCIIS